MRPGGAALALLVSGCFEYSPHAIVLDDSERDLHRKALARLHDTPAPAEFKFAVVGDTQLAFDQAEAAVDHLNARDDLAFVVQAGDFTHYGQLSEFRLMNDIFARLRVPYLVVIGIHEYLGNGEEVYARMFGEVNLAFTWGRTRFLLHDNNSREFGFDGTVPDLRWLEARLAPDGSFDHAVLVSHCPPGTSDFDPSLQERYDALLRAHAPTSFHAHEHRPRYEEREGAPLWIADSVEHRSYLVAAVSSAGIEVERVSF